MRIKTGLAAVLAALALISAPPAHSASPAVAAKSCSAGYTHAVISGQQKCLRAGEFCAHASDRQYRRYGFRCTRYYSNVQRYRLTYA
jgi:hypothetical protein